MAQVGARSPGTPLEQRRARAPGAGTERRGVEVDQLAGRCPSGSPARGSPRAAAARCSGSGRPRRSIRAKRAVSATCSRAQRDRLGRTSGCASQIRISTVAERLVRPHAPPDLGVLADRAGVDQEAHEAVVLRPSRRTRSGMPQRGNMRVKICVRVECRWVYAVLEPRRAGRGREQLGQRPSAARRSTAIARSASRMPTWTWMPKVLLRQAT